MQKNEPVKNAKEIVMEYIQAVESRDFKSARSYLSDNILFTGPLGSFDSAEPFIKFVEQANLPKLEVKKKFVNSQDVCLLYEMNYRVPPATTFVCGWFHVDDDGKISSLRVVFDPQPLLQQKK